MENHIQSFAFVLRDVTPAFLQTLRPVFPAHRALDDWRDVVCQQETRFARTAARGGSVGALWYSDRSRAAEPGLAEMLLQRLSGRLEPYDAQDPSLVEAATLLEAGFPFLKRSLFGRNAHYQDRSQLMEFLRAQTYALSPRPLKDMGYGFDYDLAGLPARLTGAHGAGAEAARRAR